MRCKKNRVCKVVRKKGSVFVSMLLILTMLTSMMIMPASAETSSYSDDTKLDNNVKVISAEEIVDGTVVKCSFDKTNKEYTLSLDNNKYPLKVDIIDEYAYVTFDDSTEHPNEPEMVVAQSAVAVALTYSAPYWAPAVVAAAKVVIAKVLIATAAIVGTYYSVDAIATTITNVKQNSISKSKAKTKEGTKAIATIQAAPKTKNHYYFSAELYNGNVVIGNPVSYNEAVNRLKSGRDVFASSMSAARNAASAATKMGIRYDLPHQGGGKYYHHFHPRGIKHYKTKFDEPHCWFIM